MTKWALGLAYNGKRFHGWQRQLDVLTVQGELERAISKIANESVQLIVAGRTDKGVHATGQVAHFSTQSQRTANDWLRGINGLTPPDVRVQWVEEVAQNFHARYAAIARRYNYIFLDNALKGDVFLDDYVWCCEGLNVDAMHVQAQSLLGEHDFTSFRAAGCQSLSPMRQINRVTVARSGNFVVLEIEGNAFLLHMVRNIASALFDVGRGHNSCTIDELLSRKNRALVGKTGPAQGLYLQNITYPGYDFPPGESLRLLSPISSFIPSTLPLD